jgi:hypothetical protein
MIEDSAPTEHPFILPGNDDCYCLFPDELESDPLVLFHGTAAKNLQSILSDGFQPQKALASSSFANKSSFSLKYACEARSEESPKGVVIAARFETISIRGIRQEPFGVHLDDHRTQPTIVSYCIVPAEYLFR